MRGNRTSLAVLGLALLVVLAFLLRREPREQKPPRAESRAVPVLPPELPTSAASGPLQPSPATPAATPAPVAGPPGTIRGGVKIETPVRPRKVVRLDSDPQCEHKHAGVVMSDGLVADANGNLQWVFVQVKSGPIGTPPPAPPVPVLMDQIRCIFTPHMVGVRVGQPLRVRSSDDLLHNVHGLPFLNKEFNEGLPEPGELVRTFSFPEVFLIKCDVHPWMRSWVGVVEHPYWAITNELGSYVIRDLPPGSFTVEAWHEQYKTVTREVEVRPGADVVLDFLLDAKRD